MNYLFKKILYNLFGGMEVLYFLCGMIIIKGYNKIEYTDLAIALYERFLDSDKKEIQIATELGLDSPNTIRNAFNESEQKVSDKVLTGVMKSVGLNGIVVWVNESREYYTSNKKLQTV